MQKIYSERKWYERLAFSPLLAKKNLSHKIAYLGVNTALLIVCNAFLEIKFIDVQFSVTLFVSIITGILLGAGSGFLACFIGDALGFMISSWGYMYMPWVGLTTATTALLSGLIFYFIKFNVKWWLYLKIGVICILSLFIGTILINSTGFYFYNENMGFSTAVNNYIETHFNGNAPYTAYVFYRLFFKGQIFNCIFNYLLAFFITPMFMRTSLFKENFPKRKKVENLEQNTDENNG